MIGIVQEFRYHLKFLNESASISDANEILKELTNTDLNAHLATIHHVDGQMPQEDVVILLLELTAKERSHIMVIDVIL